MPSPSSAGLRAERTTDAGSTVSSAVAGRQGRVGPGPHGPEAGLVRRRGRGRPIGVHPQGEIGHDALGTLRSGRRQARPGGHGVGRVSRRASHPTARSRVTTIAPSGVTSRLGQARSRDGQAVGLDPALVGKGPRGGVQPARCRRRPSVVRLGHVEGGSRPEPVGRLAGREPEAQAVVYAPGWRSPRAGPRGRHRGPTRASIRTVTGTVWRLTRLPVRR